MCAVLYCNAESQANGDINRPRGIAISGEGFMTHRETYNFQSSPSPETLNQPIWRKSGIVICIQFPKSFQYGGERDQ